MVSNLLYLQYKMKPKIVNFRVFISPSIYLLLEYDLFYILSTLVEIQSFVKEYIYIYIFIYIHNIHTYILHIYIYIYMYILIYNR